MCTCVWTNHTTLNQCGEVAELRGNLYLCRNHELMYLSRLTYTARQSASIHPLNCYPGFCYIILLPDGNVKIGYSNTKKLLKERLQALHRTVGPTVHLLTLPGGFVTEAVLHEKFKDSRILGNGELFRYTTDIAEYIAENQP